jgi:hypothetical protein
MIHKLKHSLGCNLINIRGWRTNRKIVVIESDDWGTLRTPNKNVYNILSAKYADSMFADTYDRVDNLANKDDLQALFDTLSSVTDSKGHHAVLTANTIVGNPDFGRILNSNYGEYYWEPFTETLNRYPTHVGTFDCWKDGIAKGIFKPQYHGREHLNVCCWLDLLRQGYPGMKEAFECGTWLGHPQGNRRLDIAYNYANENELTFVKKSITEGYEQFAQMFGYKSITTICPSYTWDGEIEKHFANLGVIAMQGGYVQFYPEIHQQSRNVKHFTGERNNFGQFYFMRNVHFEPALIKESNPVQRLMSDINRVFRWHKPAIISSHRLNYIGNLDPANRDNTLNILKHLLKEIVRKYPDVEFMSSDQLALLMSQNG